MTVKLMKKYILLEFLFPFAGTVCLCCIVYFIYEFFFRIHVFMAYHASLAFILNYQLLHLPLWLKDSFPALARLAEPEAVEAAAR
jgi:hypothetical protein